MASTEVFVRRASGLVRQIGTKDTMMMNALSTGLNWPLIIIVWGTALFPGANMALSSILGVIPAIFISVVYYLFSVAMPRTGGDYVWVSRVVHPAIGFMANLYLTSVLFSWLGYNPGMSVGGGQNPGLNMMFRNLAMVTGNASLVGLAETLESLPVFVAISVLILVFYGVILAVGTKNFVRLQWLFFGVSLVGLATYVITLLSVGHAGFVARFNALSGTTYGAVVGAAQQSGFQLTTTFTASLAAVVYVTINYAGYQWSSYYVGEIKSVERSQLVGIFGSLFFVAICFAVFYAVSDYVFGHEFIAAVANLWMNGDPAYTLPIMPSAPYLISFVTDNVFVVSMIPFWFFIAAATGPAVCMFITVRNFFAYSFDRVLPARICDVDRRFKAPYNAIILAFIVSLFFTYLTWFTPTIAFYAYAMLGLNIGYAIVSFAAIVFPYRRKDLFEGSPPIVKKKIGGIPVITVAGVISFLFSIFLAYASVSPMIVGILNPAAVFANVGVFVIAIVIFCIAYVYRKSKGIKMELAFKEIPPD